MVRVPSLWLAVLTLSLCAQTVTDSKTVTIDGKPQLVRKINGRWWSPDNRQLTPPREAGGFIWTIQSKPGDYVKFFHHRPLDLTRAESLHLFMNREAARAVLGDPNQTFEGSGHWFYYAANGTELAVWFGSKDELIDATYRRSEYGVSGKQVAAIERELAGRSVFKLSADRAAQRLSTPGPGAVLSMPAVHRVSVPIPAAVVTEPPTPAKRLTLETVKTIQTGASRAEVIERAGEPFRTNRIVGSDLEVETLTYSLEPSGEVRIRLEGGRVSRVTF